MSEFDPLLDLAQRHGQLAGSSARFRKGVVTDDSPLSVALGGSAVPYTDVRALDGVHVETGDNVAVLTWGHDLLVLGGMGGSGLSIQADSDSLSSRTIAPQTESDTTAVRFAVPFTATPIVVVSSAVVGSWQEWLVFRARNATTSGFNVTALNTMPTGGPDANGSGAFSWIAAGPR